MPKRSVLGLYTDEDAAADAQEDIGESSTVGPTIESS